MTYPRRLLFGRSEAEGVRRCGLWYFQEGGGENLWHFDAHVGCGHHLRAYRRGVSFSTAAAGPLGGSKDGDLRVNGGLLQPEEDTLFARLQKPGRLREG